MDTELHKFHTDEPIGRSIKKKSRRERYIWIFVAVVLIAALVGVIVYFTKNYTKNDDIEDRKSETRPQSEESLNKRIDCIPEAQSGLVEATEDLCKQRGCLYDKVNKHRIPDCFFPSTSGYKVDSILTTALGFSVRLKKTRAGPFGDDFETAVLDVEMRGDNIIRLKFDDPSFKRFKVPLDLDLPKGKSSNPKYQFKVTNNETFAFQVIRKSSGAVLWDTGAGGLVLSDQFLQISTLLPSNNIYGFGENRHKHFQHDLNFTSWPMFSRDQAPSWKDNSNLYGVHPFYTCLEPSGSSHGVLIFNSNAQEYSFTPAPMLTYRTIGGILDIYMFLGPEPENVIQQYTSVIGRPMMPPYWALGFQLCRWGYNNLDGLKKAVDETRRDGIPHDVQYADIDHYEEQKDFTIDEKNFGGLPEYFQQLKDGGMHTVIILDPALISNESNYEPYDNLTAISGAIKWPVDFNAAEDQRDSTNAVLGYVWPKGKTVFPDFFKKETRELWKRLIVKHRKKLPFDGVWIDMNEPANFGTNEEKPWNWPEDAKPYWSLKCPSNKFEDPPYRTMASYLHDTDSTPARLSEKTLCMITVQGENGEYRHYDVHSLYGWSETLPTLEGVREATGERSFMLSRSTYPGSGKYAAHWLGDNDSTWEALRESIIGMLEFNLFGIPSVGADICGFWQNSTAQLCKRWTQLGAFYPFSRNHNGNGNIEQHPSVFGPEVVKASREAIETRYWLLPYLYTLFHKAHVEGSTVARPMHHEFPSDSHIYSTTHQFLWGPALLIAPILFEDQGNQDVYLPNADWYDFYTGMKQNSATTHQREIKPESMIGLYIRGGYILPMQEPALNTTYSRKNPLKLLVAMDSNGNAEGELFWDDGKSVDTYEKGMFYLAKFSASKAQLTMTVEHTDPSSKELSELFFNTVVIYGADNIQQVYYEGNQVASEYNSTSSTLTIKNLKIPLNKDFNLYLGNEAEQIDCFPEGSSPLEALTEEVCHQRGCIFNPVGPRCYLNTTNYGYRVVGDKVDTQYGFMFTLEHNGKLNRYSHLGSPDIPRLNFTVEMRGPNDALLRIKIEDASKPRYEVPAKLNLGSSKSRHPFYTVKITKMDPFSFQVIRVSTGEVLWDTGVGGLTFSEHFLQLSTRLPTDKVYGFGENIHHSFKHDMSHKTWPMWSRDQPVGWGSSLNHYGVHPFYTCLESEGLHSHGVLLLNSNAQDYTFSPLPMLTYRTIGGIFDFYFFMGPEPENVIQQYTQVIGRPYMPPYWSLGFQLCRYGYNTLENLQTAVNRTLKANIPLDVQYADIDHMKNQMDFTIDYDRFGGLNDYFKYLRSEGMHTIIILDPTIISNVSDYEPYRNFTDTNSNIRWPAGENIPEGSRNEKGDLLGYVWPPGKVVFPDFFKNSTGHVWRELIKKHHKNELVFDGLWIDMNEPANFGTNEERPWNWPEGAKPYWSLNCTQAGNYYEHPPYRTKAAYVHDGNDRKAMLSDKTICMRAVQGENGEYKHYDVHSLYGWSQTPPTLAGLREATGERGIVISRSTFPGSGHYAGHWLGDNDSNWEEMRLSIIGILEFNLFGIPYIGADICGFMQNSTPELCKRWMQLGAFYTFSRNHNGIDSIDQDPAVFGTEVAEASRIAMETRYYLLPYLYTLFHHAHSRGNTVIRPLHHQFHYDLNTHGIHEQFMWGPALLISPILYESQSSLKMYLPKGPWYDFYTGEEMAAQGAHITLPIEPDSQIPLHVCAGHIIPLQEHANNTKFSRQKPFHLFVALKNSENNIRGYKADGELFWDDGVSIDTYENGNYFSAKFHSESDKLWMTVEHNNDSVNHLYINRVFVTGVRTHVTHVYVGDTMHSDLHYDQNKQTLEIKGLNLPLNQNFELEWKAFRRPTMEEMERVECRPDLYDLPSVKAAADPDKAASLLCQSWKCIFNPVPDQPQLPKCYIDKTAHGYTVASKNGDTMVLNSKYGRLFDSGRNPAIQQPKVEITHHGDKMLRVKIFDNATDRYEVPVPLILPASTPARTPSKYTVELPNANEDFFVKIRRTSNNKVIWDTSVGPLLFYNQFLQISTNLPSNNLYGLGEHRHANFKHDMNYKTFTIFSRDAAVNSPDYTNLYGAHPFYMNLEDESGQAHGVFLLNSNAMDIVMEPNPRLTYRTIGGILDFYIFVGDDPEDVITQYTNVIGKPYMPPYWGLGFQLSRWGYNSLDNMKKAVERTRAANIPHDIQYGDIDYFDERKDFTYDHVNFKGLPEFIKELQDGGMKFITILDPALISNETNYLPYTHGVEQDVFIKWPNGKGPQDSRPNSTSDIMLGYVWPKGKTAFPDFLKNATHDFWINEITTFHNTIPFNGLWIDMNEPANFDTNWEKPWNWPEKDTPYWTLKCTLDNNTWDLPPYLPRFIDVDYLSFKTLCMQGLQGDGKYKHYDVHSLYGWSQTQPTMRAVQNATNKRGIVISRSTFPSTGRYGGHWLGDNDSFWRNLHDSIIGILEFNLFGIPYIGADICGFFAESTPEMCQRWMELGAFYTFSRNHNGLDMKEQDPGVFGDHVIEASRHAMIVRYEMLPYVYTQFYHCHLNGGTVIRSMMHEFPKDKRTWAIDTQFMWGKAFLIAPVLEEGHMHKDVYFPDAKWFDYYSGAEVKARGPMVTVDAPRNHIPLYLKGGYILPNQKSANNTVHSRQQPLSLLIVPHDDGTAKGDIFWDDGEGIETIERGEYFTATYNLHNNTLTGVVTKNHSSAAGLMYENLWIYGMKAPFTQITVNQQAAITYKFEYFTEVELLWVSGLNVPLDSNFTIRWT